MDLLHRVEEAEGPAQLGQGHREEPVLVGPDVVEGQVLELGSLHRLVGVDVDRRLGGVVQGARHRPVPLVRTRVGGRRSRPRPGSPRVRVLMKTGLSNRLRLYPTHGATTSAVASRPIPSVANRRFQVRALASSTMGTKMNTTSTVSSSRPSMATPSDAAQPDGPGNGRALPEPVGEEEDAGHQSGGDGLRQGQLVGHPDVGVDGQQEGGDQADPAAADLPTRCTRRPQWPPRPGCSTRPVRPGRS